MLIGAVAVQAAFNYHVHLKKPVTITLQRII